MSESQFQSGATIDLVLRYTCAFGDLAPYFEGLSVGRAVASKCATCRRTWFPPRLGCCSRKGPTQWTTLAGSGAYRGRYERRRHPPVRRRPGRRGHSPWSRSTVPTTSPSAGSTASATSRQPVCECGSSRAIIIHRIPPRPPVTFPNEARPSSTTCLASPLAGIRHDVSRSLGRDVFRCPSSLDSGFQAVVGYPTRAGGPYPVRRRCGGRQSSMYSMHASASETSA